MATCYVCKEDIFLKTHKEVIDNEEREVCGKCCDRECFLCGKTKRKDGITRFSFEKYPETGEFVYIGCCCTFVAGKLDKFKLYSEKYNNMKKNDPEGLERAMQHSEKARAHQKMALATSDVAETLIDRYAARLKKDKNKGATRKKTK